MMTTPYNPRYRSSSTGGWCRNLMTTLLLLSSSFSSTLAIRVLPNTFMGNETMASVHRRLTQRELTGQKVNVPVANSPDDHLVTSMPLLDNAKFPTKHWAGLLPASDDGHKYFFYWLFAPGGGVSAEDAQLDPDIPLLIWLNGGPACSSMDGLWLENGPFRLKKTGSEWSIDVDPHSWHNAPAYVVYIDQPVGTGLSFTTNANYPNNDEKVNIDFYYFLQEFLKLHGDKFVDETITVKRPLFFSGESHAGHYIPSMMHYIHTQNSVAGMSKITIPLSGGAIGNGWFDPRFQYSAHEAAYGFAMLGKSQVRALAEEEKQCQQDLARGNYVSSTCFGLLSKVVDNSAGKGSSHVVSQYDQRKWESTGRDREFPPGHKDVESFLGQAPGPRALSALTMDVLEAIHASPSWASGQRYRECTDPPYNALKHQDGLGVTQDVKALLNADIKLMFFNGIHDLICNHVGNEIALENLDWNQQADYIVSKRYGWESKTSNKLAGYMKELPPLYFLKVLDSGHMVPMDVPDIALEMMTTFMYQNSFKSHEQRVQRKADNGAAANCPVCPAPTPIEPQPSNKEDCPVCQDCPTDKEDNKNSEIKIPGGAAGSSSTEDGLVQVPMEVVGAMYVTIGVLSLLLLCTCCYCCCCQRKRNADKAAAAAARQYEMELTGNGQRRGYADNFHDEDDDHLALDEIS